MLANLTPDLIANRVEDIDLAALAARGLQALLLDLDNTLCPWKSEVITPACEQWVARARQHFRLCLVSNSIHPRRLERVANRLGIPAVRRWLFGRKPSAGAIRIALALLETAPAQAAMIGDQVMTDVLGGNRLGLYTVWVLPLSPHEFIGTKPARLVERLLIPHFRKLGLLA